MGFSNIVAGAVSTLVGALPHDYGVKTARKVRHVLGRYDTERSLYSSARGPIAVSGVRRTLGQSDSLDQFEPETLCWIDENARDGDVLWDVGANVGLFAGYFGKVPGLRCVAFEPFASTYVELVRNLNANKVDVQAVNAALSDATSISALPLVSWEPGYTASTEADPERFGEAIGVQPCLTFRGDDFAALFGRPTLMKIDVDGAEAAVIAGCAGILPTVRSLLIEIEGDLERDYEASIAVPLRAAGLVETAIEEPRSGRNRLFTRPDPAS